MASTAYMFFQNLLVGAPAFLDKWQTLIGALVASFCAIIAAVIAWKAVMKQIHATQSERDRRAQYAAGVAMSYLRGLSEVLKKVEREEKRLAGTTDDIWRKEPNKILLILQAAQEAISAPSANPRSNDIEPYREELPLFLFNDLRLVFRLEVDLSATIGKLLEQQNVFGTFPLSDCQTRVRDAVIKLKNAINSAETSFDRYRYE
jgi:hypothetical protein